VAELLLILLLLLLMLLLPLPLPFVDAASFLRTTGSASEPPKMSDVPPPGGFKTLHKDERIVEILRTNWTQIADAMTNDSVNCTVEVN